MTVCKRGLPKSSKCKQEGGGSKFWSFSENVIIESPLDQVLLISLKPNCRLGMVLEDSLTQLPPDQWKFDPDVQDAFEIIKYINPKRLFDELKK